MQELQSSSFWPLVEVAIQVHQRHRCYRNTPCVQAGIDRANQRAISNVATIKKWTLLTRSNSSLKMRSYLLGRPDRCISVLRIFTYFPGSQAECAIAQWEGAQYGCLLSNHFLKFIYSESSQSTEGSWVPA